MKNSTQKMMARKFDNLLERLDFGIECGDGWFDILDNLFTEINKLIPNKKNAKHIYCTQVKEKYGSLRVYMSCETDEMSKLIRQAEEDSTITCEICGAAGKLLSKKDAGWCMTRCKGCYDEGH